MAKQINTIFELQSYFNGVMDRAIHHANNIDEIILAIAGGVIWKAQGTLKVRTYNGETANVLWLCTEKKTYCFKYNHTDVSILVCENSHKGRILQTFTNKSTAKEVKDFFSTFFEL